MEDPILYTPFDNAEEDWTGLSDKKKRKQLQNRINQRARRTRKLRAQLAANLPSRDEDTVLVQHSKQAPSLMAWSSNPTFPLYPGASLSSLEWDILFFARDKLWPEPCINSVWGRSLPSTVSRRFYDLWTRRMLEVPIMRHAIILVTCLDLEYLTGQDYTAVRLRHANATIKQVLGGFKEGTSSYNSISNEDLLFAVMSLSKQSHSTSITAAPGTFGLFDQPPFQLGLQFLNLWGQHQSNHLHCQAMQQIMRSRSTLQSAGVSTPGFGEALYQFDLLESAKTLSRPWMEPSAVRADFLRKGLVFLRQGQAKSGVQVQDMFAKALPGIANHTRLLDVVYDIRIFCAWVEAVQIQAVASPTSVSAKGENSYTPTIQDMSMLRDLIEHSLLSYEFIENSLDEQLCWTVCLIFVHCVVYPLPNRAPLEILLDRLIGLSSQSIKLRREERRGTNLDPTLSTSACTISFHAWAAMIGAMACHPTDSSRRNVFFAQFRAALAALDALSSSWKPVKSLVQQFIWLDRACDKGGLAIFEACREYVDDGADGFSALGGNDVKEHMMCEARRGGSLRVGWCFRNKIGKPKLPFTQDTSVG